MSTTQTVTGAVTLLYGTQGSGTSTMLIVNLDASETVWVNESSQVQYGGPVGVPVQPGASISMTATQGLWAVAAPGATVQVALIPNGTSYFFPASLANLGGVKVYIQAGQPTGTIPLNSLWLQETDGIVTGFNTWDGTEWIPQQFNASEVLAVGTIIANLIAAGQVYAGIVNGTTITGATIIADGTAGEYLGYNGTPAKGNLVFSVNASATATTDQYGNTVQPGVCAYGSGGTYVDLTSLSGGSAEIYLSTGDSSQGGPGILGTAINGSGSSRTLGLYQQSPVFTGNANAFGWLQLYSPSEDGTSTAAQAELGVQDGPSGGVYAAVSMDAGPSTPFFVIYTSATTAPTQAAVAVDSSGQVIADMIHAYDPAQTSLVADTWHDFNPLNTGYSVPSGGYAYYKRYPDNTVGLSAHIQIAASSGPGGSAVVITQAALPAAYRPARNQWGAVVGGVAAVVSGSNNWTPAVRLDTSGNIALQGIAASYASTMDVFFNVRFPLD